MESICSHNFGSYSNISWYIWQYGASVLQYIVVHLFCIMTPLFIALSTTEQCISHIWLILIHYWLIVKQWEGSGGGVRVERCFQIPCCFLLGHSRNHDKMTKRNSTICRRCQSKHTLIYHKYNMAKCKSTALLFWQGMGSEEQSATIPFCFLYLPLNGHFRKVQTFVLK